MLVGHVAATYQPGEQNLDIDFVVGAINAGRVVDGIGEQATAAQGKLDPAFLREAEVAAFTDDLDAQFR